MINYYPENKELKTKEAKGMDAKGHWSEKFITVQNMQQLHDKEFILKAHNYDPSLWDVISAKSGLWDTQGKNVKELMVSSRITVKPKKEGLSFHPIQKQFEALERKEALPPLAAQEKDRINEGENALIVPIADLHFGRYAAKIISGEDYNMDIAEKNFMAVIKDISDYAQDKKIKKIFCPVGNDLINADNIAGTTHRGTPQDNDGLWQEIVLRCQDMVVKGIELLAQVAPVETLYIKSNHDTQTAFQMYQYVAAWFRDDERVLVRQDYTDYTFLHFGQGIYGFAHDIRKKDNVHKLFDVYFASCINVLCV